MRHKPYGCECSHGADVHYERTDMFALDAGEVYGCSTCDAEKKK